MDEISINFDASEKNIDINQHKDYNGNNIDFKILKESESENDLGENSPNYNQGVADIGLDLLANNKKTIKQNDINRPDEDNSAIDIVNNNNEDDINNQELQKKLKELDRESDSDRNHYNYNEKVNNDYEVKDSDSQIRDDTDRERRNYDSNNRRDDDYNDYNDYNNYNNYKEEKHEPSIEEILREKQELLLQFDRLTKRGIKLSREYTLASNIDEMRFEYNRIKTAREIDNSIVFSRKMLMAAVTCIEFLNNRFDPFDINLDGWSENIHENVNEYDDVFEQLYEKYKNKAEVAPEIKLMMMLAGSAFMYHLTSNIFKSSMPQFENVMRKNPNIIPNMASNNQHSNQMGGQQMGNQQMGGGIDIGKIMGMMGGLGGLMGGGNNMQNMPDIAPAQNIPQTSARPEKLNNISGPLPNKSPELHNDNGDLTGPKALGIETLLKSLGSDSLASESAGGSKKRRSRKNKGNGMEL